MLGREGNFKKLKTRPRPSIYSAVVVVSLRSFLPAFLDCLKAGGAFPHFSLSFCTAFSTVVESLGAEREGGLPNCSATNGRKFLSRRVRRGLGYHLASVLPLSLWRVFLFFFFSSLIHQLRPGRSSTRLPSLSGNALLLPSLTARSGARRTRQAERQAVSNWSRYQFSPFLPFLPVFFEPRKVFPSPSIPRLRKAPPALQNKHEPASSSTSTHAAPFS